MYELPGYILLSTPRKSGRGGGVAIFLSVSYKFRMDTEQIKLYNESFECTAVEILSENGSNNIVIVSLYRPPRQSIDAFNVSISDLLEHLLIKYKNKKIILSGDTNTNLLQIKINPKAKAFFDIISNHGFLPTIVNPTRITNNTSTLIDNSFINFYEQQWSSGIIYDDLSDHLTTFLVFHKITKKIRKPNN